MVDLASHSAESRTARSPAAGIAAAAELFESVDYAGLLERLGAVNAIGREAWEAAPDTCPFGI